MQDQETKQNLKKIFDSFDKDKSGTIQLNELAKVSAELGEKIQGQQLKNIMKTLDTNNDGKISYDEFEYWWIKGRKGKLGRLVEMKAKALRMTNFLKKKFNDAQINLQNHHGKIKPDIYTFNISFGEPVDKQNCISAEFSMNIKGERHKKLFNQARQYQQSIDDKHLGLVIKLPSQNPAEAKTAFDSLINQIINDPRLPPIPIDDLAHNSLFELKTVVKDKCLVIIIIFKEELETVTAPVTSTATSVASQIGQGFYSFLQLSLNLNTTINELLEKPLVENLLKGFNVLFHTQANLSALQKLRKFAEKQGDEMPPILRLLSLLRCSKLSWKLKTPKQLQSFLQKLGIKDVVGDMPVLSDVLEQMSFQMKEEIQQNPLIQVIRKVTRFAMKNVQNNVQFIVLMGENSASHMKFNMKNVTRIHSIIFNQA